MARYFYKKVEHADGRIFFYEKYSDGSYNLIIWQKREDIPLGTGTYEQVEVQKILAKIYEKINAPELVGSIE